MTTHLVADMGDIERQYARAMHDLDCGQQGSGHLPPVVVDHELEAHEPWSESDSEGEIPWAAIVAAFRERGLILAEIDSNERDENPYIRGYNRGWADAEEGMESEMPTCRVCGCTDDAACEGGCWWVGDDLCSSCGSAEPGSPDSFVVPESVADAIAALAADHR